MTIGFDFSTYAQAFGLALEDLRSTIDLTQVGYLGHEICIVDDVTFKFSHTFEAGDIVTIRVLRKDEPVFNAYIDYRGTTMPLDSIWWNAIGSNGRHRPYKYMMEPTGISDEAFQQLLISAIPYLK